jgi:hypothetical protein
MKKTINLNFILKKFFDPKLIILSIFLSLIISTTSFFLQKKFKVLIVDVYFQNMNTAVIFNEINKLKIKKDSELSINDIFKLEYIKNAYLADRQVFLNFKTILVHYELKKIENKLNGEIIIDFKKNLDNSNFLSFKLIKNLDYANQENTYYDKNSTELAQDINAIFNQLILEYLKKGGVAQDYLNQKDFVFVHISSVKEYKFNFLLLFSTFIFISLFINLILVLLKFKKNILI